MTAHMTGPWDPMLALHPAGMAVWPCLAKLWHQEGWGLNGVILGCWHCLLRIPQYVTV